MKIVTLQSVSVARLKIATFRKITYSITCIVALLNCYLLREERQIDRFCRIKRKQVKVQATHTRTFTANGNSRPQKVA